ncbi:MAG: cob(I)alamin adenosyltransferase [Tenuifilum sp.]|jgi:cob(I)alamin adenosyltransferase|uniref:Corrinoid adenosyltransferase n=1 Tax=Tenuifilum thalassicum TaxID=2590900 RepID=A0A7D3XK30_9BACT|nr:MULTISPECIES: cob(I)yrinic acid a,c-diamide adenosyltransferase [Tenuifilum]MDI3527142.1 cob(I)alamin adenosyltransferase [Tenuifilum sp.]QKG79430.1 cob(I)yrinic acid a,c-diamide adenosyltransferase [Tenuifilum thalassicum]
MKIYTKTGDKGTTSLIGGARVPKYHPRIEAYGTVDELIAFTGLLRDQPELDKSTAEILIFVQDRLMNCASILAADCTDCSVKIPRIEDSDIAKLEAQIDLMDAQLDPITSFVLPGGHQVVSLCHVCRTVCRRAERLVTQLAEQVPLPENVVMFLNRLSDYFFTLSRKLGKDFGVEQIKWQPNL